MRYFRWIVPLLVLVPVANARGLTSLSASDSSLGGSVLEDLQGVAMRGYGGAPPPPGYVAPVVATLDERVVRNEVGTLDFWYRFVGVPGQTTTADWIQFNAFSSPSLAVSFAYISDGPGDLIPVDAAMGTLDHGDSYSAVGFESGDQEVSLDAPGTKWLLLRTDATAYGLRSSIEFVSSPSGYQGEGVITPFVFAPLDIAPVPEPRAVLLLPLALVAVLVRQGLRRKNI